MNITIRFFSKHIKKYFRFITLFALCTTTHVVSTFANITSSRETHSQQVKDSVGKKETQQTPMNSFIVAPSEVPQMARSKNGLKEQLGGKVEDAMAVCADLNKALGALQMRLATIQRNLLDTGRNLLDNAGRVRKAKKNELREGVVVLTRAREQMTEHVATIAHLETTIKNTSCLNNS